jgi:hypothetical protein
MADEAETAWRPCEGSSARPYGRVSVPVSDLVPFTEVQRRPPLTLSPPTCRSRTVVNMPERNPADLESVLEPAVAHDRHHRPHTRRASAVAEADRLLVPVVDGRAGAHPLPHGGFHQAGGCFHGEAAAGGQGHHVSGADRHDGAGAALPDAAAQVKAAVCLVVGDESRRGCPGRARAAAARFPVPATA